MWARRMVPFLHDNLPRAALHCSLAHGCGEPCFSEKVKGPFTRVQIFPSGCFRRGCGPTALLASSGDCCRCAVGSVHSASPWDRYPVRGCGWEEGADPARPPGPSLRGKAARHSEGSVWAPAPLTCGSWRLAFTVPRRHTWWFLIPGCWHTTRLAFGKAPSWAALS